MNTRSTPEEIREALGLRSGTVAVLDALGIALEEKTRVNTAMLGAVARICPFVDPDAVKETIREKLSARYAHLVEANLRTFDRGYRELRLMTWNPAPGDPGRPVQRAAPAFGYLDAPIGGVILDSGNSIVKNLSTSRQGFLPAYDPDSCVHCGICDIVCPDLCFVWSDDGDERARRAAARHRLPLLQGLPEVHRRVPDRLAHRAPRGGRLGRGESRPALPVARA